MEYELRIKDERKEPQSVDRRLRQALKSLLRRFGLRCVSIRPDDERAADERTGGEGGD